MKQLRVPFLKQLDIVQMDRTAELLEDLGSKGSIESVNWRAQYPYLPITFFYIARSTDHLFIKYSVRGNVLRAVHSDDQMPVHEDSCVEFFCQWPGEDTYYNFEFNCIGTCYAAYRKERAHKTLFSKKELQSIIRHTSLDRRPSNELLGMFAWDLTVAIPFELLGIPSDKKLPVELRANFNKCADATSLKHYVSWNPIIAPTPDFHHPECFGWLIFEES